MNSRNKNNQLWNLIKFTFSSAQCENILHVEIEKSENEKESESEVEGESDIKLQTHTGRNESISLVVYHMVAQCMKYYYCW